MNDREEQLLEILSVGHETSMRGAGISLQQALARARYREIRRGFGPDDLLPLIRARPSLVDEWIAYSEDKRTSGGWYLLEQGEIGRVGLADSGLRFASMSRAVAEYVVRELDYWDGLQDSG